MSKNNVPRRPIMPMPKQNPFENPIASLPPQCAFRNTMDSLSYTIDRHKSLEHNEQGEAVRCVSCTHREAEFYLSFTRKLRVPHELQSFADFQCKTVTSLLLHKACALYLMCHAPKQQSRQMCDPNEIHTHMKNCTFFRSFPQTLILGLAKAQSALLTQEEMSGLYHEY